MGNQTISDFDPEDPPLVVKSQERAYVQIEGTGFSPDMILHRALLVIDVQLGFFTDDEKPLYDKEDLMKKIKRLIDKFRAVYAPVIFVQHEGPKGSILEPETTGWAIHPAIQPLKKETIIRKTSSSAFVDTTLDSELKKRRIDTLIVAGLQSEFCVDSTVRHASFLGYKVILVKDAHSTLDSSLLTASQIIAHHNLVLGNGFAELKSEEEIDFAWEGCNT